MMIVTLRVVWVDFTFTAIYDKSFDWEWRNEPHSADRVLQRNSYLNGLNFQKKKNDNNNDNKMGEIDSESRTNYSSLL